MKGKLLGTRNYDDSMWFLISPEGNSVELLSKIVDFYEKIWNEEGPRPKDNYNLGESFYLEQDGVKMYFIFSSEALHVILRKEGNWEKYSDAIMNEFEFVKPKK